jgi:hypothetical protein
MLGQIEDYASYIAVGCGPKPLDTTDDFDTEAYALKDNLDFEMFRVPVISRGLITEGDMSKIVLTAELPTENRYEISEVGVFSAGENNANGAAQSRSLFTFSEGESWIYDSASPPLVTATADDGSGNFSTTVGTGAFYLNSDNPVFQSGQRPDRYERPRNMNSSILIPGNSSTMVNTSGVLSFLSGSSKTPLRLNAASLNLDSYSTEDEIRLAFSVVNKNAAPVALGEARVKIEFKYSVDGTDIASFDAIADYDVDSNRYFVISKKIKNFAPSGFSWESVSIVDVYVSAHTVTSGSPTEASSSEFYVALDGLRIENNQSNNPAYGLIGYSVLKTTNATTILKKINSSSYIEFRFALDVN